MTDNADAVAAFGRAWIGARERVLTRYARTSRNAAANLRRRSGRFPAEAADILADADRLDQYADECDAAAADRTLPTPEYLPPEATW